MTELMGRMMMEKTPYSGVASIASKKWRMQMMTKGTQQRKSVVIMVATLRCILRFRFLTALGLL